MGSQAHPRHYINGTWCYPIIGPLLSVGYNMAMEAAMDPDKFAADMKDK